MRRWKNKKRKSEVELSALANGFKSLAEISWCWMPQKSLRRMENQDMGRKKDRATMFVVVVTGRVRMGSGGPFE